MARTPAQGFVSAVGLCWAPGDGDPGRVRGASVMDAGAIKGGGLHAGMGPECIMRGCVRRQRLRAPEAESMSE